MKQTESKREEYSDMTLEELLIKEDELKKGKAVAESKLSGLSGVEKKKMAELCSKYDTEIKRVGKMVQTIQETLQRG